MRAIIRRIDERHKCAHSGKDEVGGGEGWKGRKSDPKKGFSSLAVSQFNLHLIKLNVRCKFGHTLPCIYFYYPQNFFFALYMWKTSNMSKIDEVKQQRKTLTLPPKKVDIVKNFYVNMFELLHSVVSSRIPCLFI